MAKADASDYLTRSLQLLWGQATPGRRGPKPQTSAEEIARTAVRVADAEGLAAVSMQRVATELGLTAMSLYTYVPSKDLLLEVMLDLTAETAEPSNDSADWREGVHAWVDTVWRLFAAHPWALRVQVSGPPLGPHQMALFERLLAALSGSGLPDGELFDTGMFLLSAVRGLSKLALDMVEHSGAAPPSEVDAAALRIVSPQRFPTLHRTMTVEKYAEPKELGLDAVPGNLRYGVDRLLDGVQARVAGDAPGQPGLGTENP